MISESFYVPGDLCHLNSKDNRPHLLGTCCLPGSVRRTAPLCLLEFHAQAQPLKQASPLYGKKPWDLRERTLPKHLSQFAIMCLSSYQAVLLAPLLDRNSLGRGSFSVHAHNAESSVDSSYLLNEGMQSCSPAGCPSCQEAEQHEQNARQALPEQHRCNPPPCGAPSPCAQIAGERGKHAQVQWSHASCPGRAACSMVKPQQVPPKPSEHSNL